MQEAQNFCLVADEAAQFPVKEVDLLQRLQEILQRFGMLFAGGEEPLCLPDGDELLNNVFFYGGEARKDWPRKERVQLCIALETGVSLLFRRGI